MRRTIPLAGFFLLGARRLSWVLFPGSRGMRFEALNEGLIQLFEGPSL